MRGEKKELGGGSEIERRDREGSAQLALIEISREKSEVK